MDNFLHRNSSGTVVVTAGAGFGKTALLANWLNTYRNKEYFVAYHFFNQRDDATRSVAKAYRNLLCQLYEYFELWNKAIPDSEEGLRIEIYALLRKGTTRVDLPLVIVLDGLDEAETSFSPPFPTPLPDNVFVVASARADDGEEPKYLHSWTDNAEAICLELLPRGAIIEWLKQADDGQLVTFAENNHFVNRLEEVTKGFPLYLHYLTEELVRSAKQGQDVQSLLEQVPVGFERYVEQQLRHLDELDLPDERWQFLALLTVAKEALEKEDVKAITGMNDRHLRQLHQCWQMTRWMKISQGRLYAFTHPLLGTAFSDQLGDEAEDALRKLTDHCSRWQQHHSSYALRYYADHLQDGNQCNELYELARNSEFANAQRELLPNEPELPLKTIQTALGCATDTDNAVVIAEFLLKHAHQLANVTAQESPLEALRIGSLSKALSLAELHEPQLQIYILWHLLLVWELKETNHREEVNEILSQLLRKKLPRFDKYKSEMDLCRCNIAAHILAHIFEVNPEVCIKLGQDILSDDYLWTMCKELCNLGYYTEAFEIMRLHIERKLVGSKFNKFSITRIQRISEIQAEKLGKNIALESLFKITNLLLTPRWELAFASEWASLASLQVRLGEKKLGKTYFDKAIDIAKKNQHQGRKAQDFLSIVYYQKQAGETSSHFLEDALELLQSEDLQGINTSGLYSRVKFLVETAEVKALLSRPKDAQETLKKTEAFAEQIENFEEKMECFIDIGKGYVDISNFDYASEIAKKTSGYISVKQEGILPYLWHKQAESKNEDRNQTDNQEKTPNKNFEAVVFDQLEAGKFEEARTTLSLLLRAEPAQDLSLLKAWILVDISEVQLKAEATQSALLTIQTAARFAEEIKDQFNQAQVLASLAELWTKLGSLQEASKALQRAFSIAREIRVKQEKKGAWSLDNPCSRIFATISKTQARMGDFDAALETFEMLIHDTLLKADVLRVIAHEQSNLEADPLQWKNLGKKLAIAYENVQSDPFSPVIDNCLVPRVEVFCTLAIVQSIMGDQQAALETLRYWREKAEERDRSKILANVAIAEIQIQGTDVALETLSSIKDPEWRIQVLWSIANTQFKHGLKQELLSALDVAYESYGNLKDDKTRSSAIREIAGIEAMAGLSYQAIRSAEQVLENREPMLSTLAYIFADARDLQNFKLLLTPCACYVSTAYETCSYLAKLYPEQSAEISRVINEHY